MDVQAFTEVVLNATSGEGEMLKVLVTVRIHAWLLVPVKVTVYEPGVAYM